MKIKKKKIILIVFLAVIFLSAAAVGLTYAYFRTIIAGNEEASRVILEAADLSLVYDGGPSINVHNILPSSSVKKVFTVKNTGTIRANYSIDFEDMVNEFLNDELVVSYNCVSYINYGTDTEEVLGECPELHQISVDDLELVNNNQSKRVLKNYISIDPNITHEYTLKIKFIEVGSNQDYNQDKNFSTKIKIDESNFTFDLSGTLLDFSSNLLSSHPISIHSLESSIRMNTLTDSNGEFEFKNVPIGEYIITIYDPIYPFNNNYITAVGEVTLNIFQDLNINGSTLSAPPEIKQINFNIIKNGYNINIE